jgi:putative membrane protein
MIKIILHILVTAGALLLISHVVPGIYVSSFGIAILAALVWGIISVTLKPLLNLLALPINLVTLGLFSLIINALLFWLLGALIPHFSVSGFVPALEGSVILMVVALVLHAIF